MGVADVAAEGECTTACGGAELAQVAFGDAWIAFWFVPLAVGLGLGDTVWVGWALGLSLGLTVALGLLVLALAEALALGLVVLPLLGLPLDDVAGAAAFRVGLLAALLPVSAADGDGQELGVV